jgi:hypothetical protein
MEVERATTTRQGDTRQEAKTIRKYAQRHNAEGKEKRGAMHDGGAGIQLTTKRR